MSSDPRFVDPEEERKRFVSLNLERIEHEYSQAVEKGMESPLVVALDVRDDTSQEIIAALSDICGTSEVPDDNPGVVFSMPVDEAIERIGDVNGQARRFIEHALHMKSVIGKQRELMIFMVISFANIECKLHPLPG